MIEITFGHFNDFQTQHMIQKTTWTVSLLIVHMLRRCDLFEAFAVRLKGHCFE